MKQRIIDLYWVVVQFGLLLLYFTVPAFSDQWPELVTDLAMVFLLLSLVFFGISVWQMRTDLSPFPTPLRGSHLRKDGLYRWVRHPMYGSLLLFLFSFAVMSSSLNRLVFAAILLVFFYFKSRYEERKLLNHFPEYADFRQTRGRFFPFL